MNAALKNSESDISEIDYINAHGTSTMDAIELRTVEYWRAQWAIYQCLLQIIDRSFIRSCRFSGNFFYFSNSRSNSSTNNKS